MTRATVNISTLYSSAQCVLSVVGSVGVILLFAGIPQLIYSPTVSVANLMTFLLGAILITTMVAGNSFLNYKYRKLTRAAQQQQRDNNSTEAAAASQGEMEDKPPSYEAILSSDGLPPDYFSVLNEKPPKYEDIAAGFFNSGSFTPAVPLDVDITTLGNMERPYSTEGVADPQVNQAKGVTESSNQVETDITTSTVSKKEDASTVATEVTTNVTNEHPQENITHITISHDSTTTTTTTASSTQEEQQHSPTVVSTSEQSQSESSHTSEQSQSEFSRTSEPSQNESSHPPTVTVNLSENSTPLDLRESES
ncbi:ubiquitin-associated protein 2-like [Palaemon carinicauda]|uniref:ubiquitin-associated protein 2-like n=1 Tax=Palaemon carinicauda TaxID=392227 RepID=UPI0035B59C02